MTSPRKKVDDDQYRKLLEDFMYHVLVKTDGMIKPSSPRLPIKSSDCRVVYHRLMIRIANACAHQLTVLQEVVTYHEQIIHDDSNHRHPKNLISLLLTEKFRSGKEDKDSIYDVLTLTIPLDGEVPKKLVDALSTVCNDVYQTYVALDHAYVDLLNSLENQVGD